MSNTFHLQLLGIMKRELESKNLQLSQYCQQQIEQMVSHGVQRMRVNNATDNAGYTLRAERNLRALIRYFCEYARDMETFPKLSNSHFDAALLACPTYWPYSTSG